MNVFKALSTSVVILFLTACTINVGPSQSDEMSSAEQDFLACELWVEAIGAQTESNPGTVVSQPEEDAVKEQNISVLSGYIKKLESVDSTLALQVKRILENMREYNTIHLETGEYPMDLAVSQMSTVGPAGEKCDELVGWEYDLEAPTN